MVLPPIAAETIFHLGPVPVTNSMVNAWIVSAVLIVVAILVSRKVSLKPRGLQNFAEAVIEFLLKQAEGVTGSYEAAKKFLPLAGTIFLFILMNNWLGLFPGTGSIGIFELVHGKTELVPVLRSAGSDLNLTVAIAIISVVTTNILGIMAVGFFAYANKFIKITPFLALARKRSIGDFAIGLFVALVEFMVGIIEIVSEVAKLLSLSLRLFGNIFAGEVLMVVIAGLFAFFLPLPFIALELLVGVIQATVFAMLVLVYATVATAKEHGEAH
ncbi:MAG: FoF1 ATP synthase subunit a [bacterium]